MGRKKFIALRGALLFRLNVRKRSSKYGSEKLIDIFRNKIRH